MRRQARLLLRAAVIGLMLAPAAQADPLGTWTSAAPMLAPRSQAAAADLSDGRVLVAGGDDASGQNTASAEIYDPRTNAWSAVPSMGVPRDQPAAAPLPGDRVLVAAGQNDVAGQINGLTSVEIYNGASNSWTPAAPLLGQGGPGFDAAPLPGGLVLVVDNSVYDPIAEIYNPSTNTWTWAAEAGTPFGTSWGGSGVELADGRVFVPSEGEMNTPQIYNISTNSWSYATWDPWPQWGLDGPAARLGDGNVLEVGGYPNPGVAGIYGPGPNSWWQATSEPQGRSAAIAASLPDGDVLVAGGTGTTGQALSSADIFSAPASYPATPSVQETQIDGNAMVGSVLSATAGSGSFRYQWQRCSTTCVDVGQQGPLTSDPSLYSVSASDAGTSLRVLATGADGVTNPSNELGPVIAPAVTLNGPVLLSVDDPAAGIFLTRNEGVTAASVRYVIATDSGGVGPYLAPFTGTLDFAPGQTQAEIPIPISDHGVLPFQRDFRIALFDPVGLGLGSQPQAEIRLCTGEIVVPPPCGDGTPRSAANPLSLAAAPPPSDPLAGARLFVDKTGTAIANAANALESTNPSAAAKLRTIVDRADVTRFGTWNGNYPGRAVSDFLDRVQQQEPGTVPMLATYKLVNAKLTHPNCGRWADPPESQAAYHQWVTNLAEGIGYRPAVLFLEMDSLITVGCLSPHGLQIRLNELRDAINVLSNAPHLVVYLDAGAADALPAKRVASLLERAGVAHIQGFFLNSTHFDWTRKEIAYGEEISRLTGGKHFVINTAENGQGPLVPKNRGKHGNEVLCNPAGRGLGPLPTTNTGFKNVDAFAWIADPGVSGGVCGPGQPAGGRFSVQLALGLIRHADFKVR